MCLTIFAEILGLIRALLSGIGVLDGNADASQAIPREVTLRDTAITRLLTRMPSFYQMPNLWCLLGPLASSVVNRISKLKELIGRTLGASRSTESTEFIEELEKFRKSQIDEIIVTGVSVCVKAWI